LPIGAEDNFKGVVDLINFRGMIWNETDKGMTYEVIDIPEDMIEEATEWREKLLEAKDKYCVLLSHHPSPTLVNDYAPTNAPRRVIRDELLKELYQHKNLIAWIAGHVHRHASGMHTREDGSTFLEFTTASHIDWPQQSRVLEIVKDYKNKSTKDLIKAMDLIIQDFEFCKNKIVELTVQLDKLENTYNTILKEYDRRTNS
jgi:hypothetical protein